VALPEGKLPSLLGMVAQEYLHLHFLSAEPNMNLKAVPAAKDGTHYTVELALDMQVLPDAVAAAAAESDHASLSGTDLVAGADPAGRVEYE
jgi:hypothetical protein